MGKISFNVNNGGKLEICQTKHDGSISGIANGFGGIVATFETLEDLEK